MSGLQPQQGHQGQTIKPAAAHQAQPQAQDVSALFSLLESNDKRTVEEVKGLIHENLNTSREPSLLYNLVDYYITSHSQASVDILIGIREPHDKALFDRLVEHMRGTPRLQVLTLLGYIVRKQPLWLHKITGHPLLNTLIKCLKQDNDVPVLMSACLIVTTLLPVVPVGIGHHLQDIFHVFTRLAGFSIKRPVGVPDIFLLHLQIGVYALFHRLYGMYPCSYLAFLRTYYSKEDSIEVFEKIIKPMLERVRVHPLLITGSKDMELSNKRWKRMEIHDIVIECAKLSLDTIEGTVESNVRHLLPMFRPGGASNMSSLTAPPTPADPNYYDRTPSFTFPAHHDRQDITPLSPQHHHCLPAYTTDDDGAWTPSRSCGLDTPPELSLFLERSDNDYVHILHSNQGPYTSGSSSAVSTPASDTQLTTQDTTKSRHDLKSLRSRRQTMPIFPSKSRSLADTRGANSAASLDLQLPPSVQRAHDESRAIMAHLDASTKLIENSSVERLQTASDIGPPVIGRSDSLGLLSTNSQPTLESLRTADSLGLLTGGYRPDDTTGTRAPPTDARQNDTGSVKSPNRNDSSSQLSMTSPNSAVSSPGTSLNVRSGATPSDEFGVDNETSRRVKPGDPKSPDVAQSCDLLTAQSAAMFIRHVSRTRYTSMTVINNQSTQQQITPSRHRCASMPIMTSQTNELDVKITSGEVTHKKISQSTTNISQTNPVEDVTVKKAMVSEPGHVMNPWEELQRQKMPYEHLFVSALPYTPIAQCQRCLDRSFSVPDDSAPINIHQFQSAARQSVLGSEIPVYSTLTPSELLDRHLLLGSKIHRGEAALLARKSDAESTNSGAVTEEELNILRAQVNQVHSQLMYERHRREQHALRNRRLLGKIAFAAALEEQNLACKQQLTNKQADIEYLQTALESLRYEYRQYKEKQTELNLSRTEEICALRREKDELHDTNIELRSTIERHKHDHQKLLTEFKLVKSDSFTLRQELAVAQRRLSRHADLISQVTRLNKEVLLMGELHKKYQERLKQAVNGQNGQSGDTYRLLISPYTIEIDALKRNNRVLQVQVEAVTHRATELDELLTQKERLMSEQKRISETCKHQSLHQMESLNQRIRLLQKIIHRLEGEILDLYSRLHKQRHDDKVGQLQSKGQVESSPTSDPVPDHQIASPITIQRQVTSQSSPRDNETQFSLDSTSSPQSSTHAHPPSALNSSASPQSLADSSGNDGASQTDDVTAASGTQRNYSTHRSISASIPSGRDTGTGVRPGGTSPRHASYPNTHQVQLNFDYTAWKCDVNKQVKCGRPAMLDYDHDRPSMLDYDQETPTPAIVVTETAVKSSGGSDLIGPTCDRNDDVVATSSGPSTTGAATGSSVLVDSGVHESKSE